MSATSKLLATALAVCLAAAAIAGKRSSAVRAEFQRSHPCPVNGATRGKCPGWEIDHVVALCAGGADATTNMQWLTREDHRAKTRLDVMHCRMERQRVKRILTDTPPDQ